MDNEFILRLFEKNLAINRINDMKISDYSDAYKYSDKVASVLNKTLEIAQYSGYEIDEDFIEGLLKPLLNKDFMMCKDAALKAQTELNKAMKVGIKPIEAHSKGAIEHIVDVASNSEEPLTAIKQSIDTFGHKIVSDSLKRNADFQSKIGMQIYVERVNGDVGLRSGTKYAEPCKYCDKWEGIWEYPGIPDEVWGFHDGCTCSMVYHNKKGEEEIIH